MKNKTIEAEGGELILSNEVGDHIIIPKDKRSEVLSLIEKKDFGAIDKIALTLPVDADYAEDGTIVSKLYEQKTGKSWSTARAENLTDGSYEGNMRLRARLMNNEFSNNLNKETFNETTDNNSYLNFKDNDQRKVSEIYEDITGKSWNTAKSENLTDGSYEKNMILRKRLLSNEFSNNSIPEKLNTEKAEEKTTDNLVEVKTANNPIEEKTQKEDYSSAETFNEAFRIARKQLGANQIFEYRGRRYGTNIRNEKFNPTEETLSRYNMNKNEVKERIEKENKLASSVYSTKKTVKLEPEYKDWEKIKQRKEEINKMNNADIIKGYHEGSDETYLIVDKKRGKMHLMKGSEEVASYNVGTGENEGDEQTKTVVRDGKVYWDEGNKTTGAGIYTVSGSSSKNPKYSNAPTWNFVNEKGIEVPMALHSSFGSRTKKIKDSDESNDRLSNGCINGICYDLKDLYQKGYKEGQKMYVLPDNKNNKYEIRNNKLVFSSDNPDVNSTVETLKYNPIKISTTDEFSEENPEALKMSKSIMENKQSLMKDLQIDGDIYNDIALATLGIAGQESNYGRSPKYMMKTEFTQDVLKYITNNKSYNSKGLTQIKYDAMNSEVKKMFNKYNITKESLDSGEKAAIAQIIIMANAYKYELPHYRETMKELNVSDIEALLYLNQGKRGELKNKTATPDKNIYIQKVKKYGSNFNLKELN